jgi:hypothetical protein
MAGEHRTDGGGGSHGGAAAPSGAAAPDAARAAREREWRRRSAVPFLDARSRRPVDALETSRLVVSSQDWAGPASSWRRGPPTRGRSTISRSRTITSR